MTGTLIGNTHIMLPFLSVCSRCWSQRRSGLQRPTRYSCPATARRERFFLFHVTPMIVPAILIAIGTFHAYGRVGLNSTITGLVLAHTMLVAPLPRAPGWGSDRGRPGRGGRVGDAA